MGEKFVENDFFKNFGQKWKVRNGMVVFQKIFVKWWLELVLQAPWARTSRAPCPRDGACSRRDKTPDLVFHSHKPATDTWPCFPQPQTRYRHLTLFSTGTDPLQTRHLTLFSTGTDPLQTRHLTLFSTGTGPLQTRHLTLFSTGTDPLQTRHLTLFSTGTDPLQTRHLTLFPKVLLILTKPRGKSQIK